jgi:hypothetical protein
LPELWPKVHGACRTCLTSPAANENVLIVGTMLIGGGRSMLEGVTGHVPSELVEAEPFPPTTSWLRYRVS